MREGKPAVSWRGPPCAAAPAAQTHPLQKSSIPESHLPQKVIFTEKSSNVKHLHDIFRETSARYRAVEPSSGSNMIPRWARPSLAGLRPHSSTNLQGVRRNFTPKDVIFPKSHQKSSTRSTTLPNHTPTRWPTRVSLGQSLTQDGSNLSFEINLKLVS